MILEALFRGATRELLRAGAGAQAPVGSAPLAAGLEALSSSSERGVQVERSRGEGDSASMDVRTLAEMEALLTSLHLALHWTLLSPPALDSSSSAAS